jgi:hypothetical protein
MNYSEKDKKLKKIIFHTVNTISSQYTTWMTFKILAQLHSVEVKDEWIYASTSSKSLHGMERDNSTSDRKQTAVTSVTQIKFYSIAQERI